MGAEGLTNGRFLVFRLVVEVIGVDVGHVSQLLGLVFVGVKCLFVQCMPDGVRSELVICVKRMEVLQCLSKTSKVVVNIELFPKLRQLL